MTRMAVAAALATGVGVSLAACETAMPRIPTTLAKEVDAPVIARPAGTWASRVATAPVGRPGAAADALPEAQHYPGTGQFTAPKSGGIRIKPAATSGEPVTLNFVDIPISQAAKAVLGDILRLNYVVDETVKGTVTVRTSEPVPLSAVPELFEAALRSKGAAIVEHAGVHRIVPAAEARPMSETTTEKRRPVNIGQRTQTLTMKYVSAREMERLLRPTAPKNAIVRVDEARNMITVAASESELAAMRETVETFDVDWLKGMSFALIPLKASDAEGMVKELDTIFTTGQEGPLKGMVRFVPNRRLRAILVISAQPDYLKKAEIWINRLDKAARGEEEQYVYQVQNRPAVELAKFLQKVFSATIEQANPPDSTVAPKLTETRIAASETRAPTDSSRTFPSRAAPTLQAAQTNAPDRTEPDVVPAGTAGSASSEATPKQTRDKIRIVADDANNSLLIIATPQDYQRVLKTLERVDVVAKQVLLEATIAEVSLNDQLKAGLRWHFQRGNNGISFTDAVAGAVAPSFPGFSYFFSTPNIQVALDALSAITNVNVISTPTLMVLDNKTATLQVGDQVPITTQSSVSTLTPGAPIVNSVQFRDTGVILHVTPRVSDSGRVVLEIEQEVSDVVKTTTSNIDSPTIQQRRIKTTVAVNDGEGFALGGLVQERNKLNRTQVPLAGDIPLVGNLFKTKSDSIDRTELLIVIRPHVVRDTREARWVTEEFKKQLNLTLRPQRGGPPSRRENVERLVR
jgi:general secretion pathway protein D